MDGRTRNKTGPTALLMRDYWLLREKVKIRPNFYFLKGIGKDLGWTTGTRRGHADDYCMAQTFGQLATIFHEPSWIHPFREQADSILTWPHTESLEVIKGVGDREWAWWDALFMGPPAFAYLSTATGDLKYLDSACAWWWKTTDYLYNQEEYFYYRLPARSAGVSR